jgi:hypothetical protein
MIDENIQNLEMDDVLDVIKDFPVKPTGRGIIITTNTTRPEIGEGAAIS